VEIQLCMGEKTRIRTFREIPLTYFQYPCSASLDLLTSGVLVLKLVFGTTPSESDQVVTVVLPNTCACCGVGWDSVFFCFHVARMTSCKRILRKEIECTDFPNSGAYHCNTLNGNNGEATNTDDLSEYARFVPHLINSLDRPDLTLIERKMMDEIGVMDALGSEWLGTAAEMLPAALLAAGEAGVREAWERAKDERYRFKPLATRRRPRLVGVEENPGPVHKAKGPSMPRSKGKPKQPKVPKATGKKQPTVAYPSAIPTVDQAPKLGKSIRIKRRVQVRDISSPGTIVGPGHVFMSLSIDRSFFSNTVVSRYFQMYENFKANYTKLDVVPTVATNTAGTAYVVPDTDGNDSLPVGSVKSIDYITGHYGARQHSIFGEPWSVVVPGTGRMLFTDLPNIVSTNTRPSDNRLSSAGAISFVAGAGFATTSTNVASAWVEIDYEFYNPSFTEDEDVILCAKSCGLASDSILGAVTSISFQNLMSLAMGNGSTVLYSEYSYQQFAFDGTNFNLPPGFYLINQVCGLSGAPGTTTETLGSLSGTFSADSTGNTTSVSTQTFEWVNKPATITANVDIIQSMAIVRVVAPAAGKPYWQFVPSFTTTNSINVNQFGLLITRLPSSVGGLFLDWYPTGNSGINIEFTFSGTRVASKPYLPSPISHPPINVSQREYEAYLAWKRAEWDTVTLRDVDEDSKSSALQQSSTVATTSAISSQPGQPSSVQPSSSSAVAVSASSRYYWK